MSRDPSGAVVAYCVAGKVGVDRFYECHGFRFGLADGLRCPAAPLGAMQQLMSGQSDALKNYLAVMSRFHRRSWDNCLLIYSQRPKATHIAGFHAWLKLRRYVRKGEKGIVILAPMVGKKKSGDELDEDAQLSKASAA